MWDTGDGRSASRASTTASTAPTRARRPRTTSRSGSAPTSRGCCALTGAKADGWLPSMGYLELDRAAGDMTTRIDAAAADGRPPPGGDPPAAQRRRRRDGSEFLERRSSGRAADELTLSTGMSTYILSVGSADDVRRFAEEVAPRGPRAGRRRPAPAAAPRGTPEAGAGGGAGGRPLAVTPTPDDGRRAERRARVGRVDAGPTGPAPDPGRRYTRRPAGRRPAPDRRPRRPARGARPSCATWSSRSPPATRDPAAVRSFITRMTIRQNNWTLGTFCETYCRVVTQPPHARGPQRLPAPARAATPSSRR